LIKSNTPFEIYQIGDRQNIWVKREDLCCEQARFSKIRGVEAHLRSVSASTIGVLDTRHSKAGWGVAYIAQQMGKRCVVYYPSFKDIRGLRLSQVKAKEWGAELVGLPAGRSCILYHRACRDLAERFPNSYMLPNALKLSESVEETANELIAYTPREMLIDKALWVVSVSSGTLAAGVIKGIETIGAKPTVILHMGYSRKREALVKYIQKYAAGDRFRILMVDEGYSYADAVRFPCPFPCNPFYDLKAWRWLYKKAEQMSYDPIIFWNIGE